MRGLFLAVALCTAASATPIAIGLGGLLPNRTYYLNFQFTNGDGLGNSYAYATAIGFEDLTGLVLGSPNSPAPGEAGGPPAGTLQAVADQENAFFDDQDGLLLMDFRRSFLFTGVLANPRITFSFQFGSTAMAPPDVFAIAILDREGNEIPTDDPTGLNKVGILDFSFDTEIVQATIVPQVPVVNPIPEPGTWALAGAALATLVGLGRRRSLR